MMRCTLGAFILGHGSVVNMNNSKFEIISMQVYWDKFFYIYKKVKDIKPGIQSL
jgi:hypothetical protein